jgi:FkbM family methyltransferase
MVTLKSIAKYILTFPQVMLHRVRGVDIQWQELVTFFRYFPWGRIDKDNYVLINYLDKPIKFYFDDLGPMIAGEFAINDYNKLPIKNMNVLDIGSGSGDTPIMFALHGAAKVIGYEVNERYFELSKRNVAVNHLSNKISLNLVGVASKKILPTDEILGAIVPDRDRHLIEKAKFKTLDTIISESNFSNNIVMKMDVDGYEYEILRSTHIETLKKLDHITLEYHFGTQDIPEILETAGFRVTITPTSNVLINNHPKTYQKMEIGLINAHRELMPPC